MECDILQTNWPTDEYAIQLGRDLNEHTDVSTKKKHIASLLKWMSTSKYAKVEDVLNKIKDNRKNRYKCSWIEREIENIIGKIQVNKNEANDSSQSNTQNHNYLLCLLNLLKGLLDMSTDRMTLREELKDLKIPAYLDLMSSADFQMTLELSSTVAGLKRQLCSFYDPSHINLSDPENVFYAVNSQVKGKPQYEHLKLILQNLLRFDFNNPLYDSIWKASAKFTEEASVVEEKKELSKLLKDEIRLLESGSKRQKLGVCKVLECTCMCHEQTTCFSSYLPPPPPPPPLPPIHFPFIAKQIENSSFPKNTCNDEPDNSKKIQQNPSRPPLPPPFIPSSPLVPPPILSDAASEYFSQRIKQNLPVPSKKMKKLQWCKIPHGLVLGHSNVWTRGHSDFSRTSKVNFGELEMMFATTEKVESKISNDDAEVKKRKSEDQGTLLEGKRSLNINIFLHQIKMPYKQMIDRLVGKSECFLTIEKLKELVRILPEPEELELIKSYNGDISKLGNAEKFYYELINYPTFNKSVETQLMKEELQQMLENLTPTLETFAMSTKQIQENKLLPDLFELVLLTGNFLNTGGYAAEASAFKLSSLSKLSELKSNVQGITLMHYLAQTATKSKPEMKELSEQLKFIKETTQYSFVSVISDISTSKKKLETIEKCSQALADPVTAEMRDFLKKAQEKMAKVEGKMEEVEKARKQLAEYFCEDEESFKLDECLSIVNSFVDAFNKAIKENTTRSDQINRLNASEVRFRRQSSLDLKSKAKLKNRKSENFIFSNNSEFSDLDTNSKAIKRYSLVPKTSTDQTYQMTSSSSTNIAHDFNVVTRSSTSENDIAKDNSNNENNSHELFNILNNSCINNGFIPEGGVRMRKKAKAPFPSGDRSVSHERERSTPELDSFRGNSEFSLNEDDVSKYSFDRNHFYRKSMIESRHCDFKRKDETVEKNVSFAKDFISVASKNPQFPNNSYPHSNVPQLTKTNTHHKKIDENNLKNSVYENKTKSNSANNNEDVLKHTKSPLTEHAMINHSMMNWKSNNSSFYNDSNTNDSRLKQRISEYRTNDQVNRIHETCGKAQFSQRIPLDYNAANSIQLKDCESPRSIYMRDGRFENESVCSGTDEGFESMRNSVVSDDNNRTSPLHDTLNNTLTNNNTPYKENTTNSDTLLKVSYDKQLNGTEHSAITCSLDSLVYEKKLSFCNNATDIRSSNSVVLVDLPKGMHCADVNDSFLNYSDVNTPNKLSTSTLKSSGSGLHLEHSNPNLNMRKIEVEEEEMFKELQTKEADDILRKSFPKDAEHKKHKSHSQPPTHKQLLKNSEHKRTQRHRNGSTSESSTSSEKKNKVNVNELSARLSQPRRPHLQLNDYIAPQNIVVVSSPVSVHRAQKVDKSSTSISTPIESFKRSSQMRSTLPVKVVDKKRDIPPPHNRTMQPVYALNNNITPIFPNTSNDLPPKPPARTTSMTQKQENDLLFSQKRKSTNNELVSKLPNSNNSQLNNTFTTPRPTRNTMNKPRSAQSTFNPNSILMKIRGKPISPSSHVPIENKESTKLCRPSKPRTQTLTTYKR